MRIYNKNSKGFTLIELVIVIALLGITIIPSVNAMIFSIKAQDVIVEEFDLQSSMRLASEIVIGNIRDSSAMFMLNDTHFNTSSLKKGWNYFGLTPGKSKFVHYVWDKSSDSHIENVLIPEKPGIKYNLVFNKNDQDSMLANFNITAVSDNNSNPKAELSSNINAISTVVIDDTGSLSNPAIALAYRSDDIPNASKPRIIVTVVVDKSGSMAWDMWGNTITNGYSNPISRLSIMREKTLDLLNELAAIGNVHVAIIKFDKDANKSTDINNKYHRPYNIDTDKAILDGLVTGLNKADGGTNTGDAMRQSYYVHKDFSINNSGDILHYTILLGDGNPTYSTVKSGSHYYGNSNIGVDGVTVAGSGGESEANITSSLLYVKDVSTNLYVNGGLDMKTFIIGFSANPTHVDRLISVAEYTSSSTNERVKGLYYPAADGEALASVYRDIRKKIELEAWHIYGPIN